jgi:hypothetical protein
VTALAGRYDSDPFSPWGLTAMALCAVVAAVLVVRAQRLQRDRMGALERGGDLVVTARVPLSSFPDHVRGTVKRTIPLLVRMSMTSRASRNLVVDVTVEDGAVHLRKQGIPGLGRAVHAHLALGDVLEVSTRGTESLVRRRELVLRPVTGPTVALILDHGSDDDLESLARSLTALRPGTPGPGAGLVLTEPAA